MSNEKPVELTEAHLKQLDALQAKISRTLSEHRQSFGHNDEQFWSYCSCNENEPHVMADGPDVPDPVEKRSFWVAGAQIFAEHLAARAVDEVEEAGWVSPEQHAAAMTALDALLRAGYKREDHLVELYEKAKAELIRKVARVEALADAAEATAVGPPFVFTRDLRAALAEPERDKESGR